MNTVHNARVNLVATALNNLGVGCLAAGIIAPMANGQFGGVGRIPAWTSLGADLILMPQVVLGRLR